MVSCCHVPILIDFYLDDVVGREESKVWLCSWPPGASILPPTCISECSASLSLFFFLSDVFRLELAKDELQQRGNCVLGGYMSPVNDAYKKKVICGIGKFYEIGKYIATVLLTGFNIWNGLGSLICSPPNSLMRTSM